MVRDPEAISHQEWLGYVQPIGLVVSIPAMLAAQAHVNRNIIPDHQRFLSCLPKDKTDEFIPELRDFAQFTRTVLNWRESDLEAVPPGDARFSAVEVTLPEYHETLRPTHSVREQEPKDPKHPWMMLIQVLPTATDLDTVATADSRNWQATPQAKFERLLRETRVPLGLLVNGRQIRMVYAPRGETSGYLTFGVAEMAQVAGRSIFAALHMLLCEERLFSLGEKQRLPAILADSRKYQNVVSTQLAEQVLASLYELVRGFQAADDQAKGTLLHDVLAEDPNHVYGGLLTVLMRLVFTLYAEDRGLISTDSVYANFYSVTGLFERLRADDGRYPDTMNQRYGAWAQLLTLFRLIYEGGSHGGLKIPPRHGYLFDPDRYNFLEGRPWKTPRVRLDGPVRVPHVSDGVVFRVLNNLLILDGERLSYRTLDVEQIGSVYEVTMGFALGVAKGPTIAIKPKKPLGAPVPINLEELLVVPGADRAKWLKSNTDQEVTGEAAAALKVASTIPELLAAIERRIARTATPSPIPKGAMVPIPSDERRRSGSNYTPRSLTQPIVDTTLRPILQRLGERPTPKQILDIKVCDPAKGSGAFLVEACRQLGDELVKAWHYHKQLPVLPPDEDEVLHARRLVAQRCLYGVDRNPMAVDLAKLSLWLVTLAKDHPFTFLDHNLRCGDSLVGLTRKQISEFHWKPDKQMALGQQFIQDRIRDATAYRQEILAAGDHVPHDTKRQKLAAADDRLDGVRFFGDLVIAAFFGADKDRLRMERRNELLGRVSEYLRTMNLMLRPGDALNMLGTGARAIRPFHWEIEFPEVFERENGGFDAIVGNPPFAGKNTLIAGNAHGYIDWLKTIHEESHGNADLVAHFFRRSFNLLRLQGNFGLIATNSIAQGDTRSTGLRWICNNGGTIYAARRRYKWPGSAAVVVSVVHGAKGKPTPPYDLDGNSVWNITAFLFHGGGNDNPASLKANEGRSFIGCYALGMGFTFDPADNNGSANPISLMHELIATNPKNSHRIFPYIGGEEINDSPTHAHQRYVINFGEMDEDTARRGWPALMKIIENKVKPERLKQKDEGGRQKWWLFLRPRTELQSKLALLDRTLAISRIGNAFAMTFLDARMVLNEKVVVFPFRQYAAFAVFQTRVHEVWVRFLSSTLKDDLQYTPSECCETFPFPENFETDLHLECAGQIYYEFRASIMVKNNEGLTKTYNRFHDPNERSPDILRLRELHAAMDQAVLDAYGWTNIPIDFQFLLDYEEVEDESDTPSSGRGRKKPWRYRWPDEVRDEVLARLLDLNKKRAEPEKLAGAAQATTSKPVKAVAKKAAALVPSIDSPLFAYPATDVDRLICATSLAAVEQSDGLSSTEHLNIVLLTTHPEWCKEFLEPKDVKLLEKAIAKAPTKMFVGKNDSIRWKDCRDYLEHTKAIDVDHGATEQFIATTGETSTVKATMPGGVDAVVALAVKAGKAMAKVSKDATKASSQQKQIITAFRQQAKQMGLVAA